MHAGYGAPQDAPLRLKTATMTVQSVAGEWQSIDDTVAWFKQLKRKAHELSQLPYYLLKAFLSIRFA